MCYSIRQTNDVTSVADLHKKTFPLDKEDSKRKSHHWLVRFKNESVGFCSVREFNDHVLFLSRAGVLDAHQGKGLHVRMIRTRVRWAKKHKFKSVITYTTIDNIKSSANLEKCGFKRYIPGYRYAGQNVLYYIREL